MSCLAAMEAEILILKLLSQASLSIVFQLLGVPRHFWLLLYILMSNIESFFGVIVWHIDPAQLQYRFETGSWGFGLCGGRDTMLNGVCV